MDSIFPHRFLAWSGHASLNSSCLNTEFMSPYLQGGFISDDKKLRTLDRFQSNNRFGADLSWQILYGLIPNKGFLRKKNLGWYFHLGSNTIVGAQFTDDFGKLALFGNVPWLGDTLRLSPLGYRSLTWQELGFGLFRNYTSSFLKWNWFLSAQYVSPNEFSFINLNKGELYTALDGANVNLSGDFVYRSSDPHRSFYLNPRGAGFSLHGGLGLQARHWGAQVEVRDWGWVGWNIGSRILSLDTAFHFEGVYIPHILKVDTLFFSNLVDSLSRTLIPQFRYSRFGMKLPALFSLKIWAYVPGNHLALTAQIRYRASFFQIPEFSLGLIVQPHPVVAINFSGRYGGWGRWNGGLEVGFKLNHGWRLGMGTASLDAMIIPHINAGLGGYFCLIKSWKK